MLSKKYIYPWEEKKYFSVFWSEIATPRGPDWGGTSVALCARGLKNEPIWPFSWYPPEKRKKILQLSLLPHFSNVSALLEACYSRSSIQFQIFLSFLIFLLFLIDFMAFWWILMVFDGFWCPLPLHNNRHRSCPRTQISPFRLTKLNTNVRKRFKYFPGWYFVVREVCTIVFTIARFFS